MAHCLLDEIKVACCLKEECAAGVSECMAAEVVQEDTGVLAFQKLGIVAIPDNALIHFVQCSLGMQSAEAVEKNKV